MDIKIAKEVIKLCLYTKYTPLLIGETGVGKSQTIKQLAKELNMIYLEIRPGQMDPGDFIGLPFIENTTYEELLNEYIKTPEIKYYLTDEIIENIKNSQLKNKKIQLTKYGRPSWMPIFDTPTLLFIDEINRGSPEVLQANFQLVLDKRIHEHFLPKNSHVIAAINPNTKDYNVTPMDDALISRFIHIPIEVSKNVWLEYAENTKYEKYIIDHIKNNERALGEIKFWKNELKPNPRCWEIVNDILIAAKQLYGNDIFNDKKIFAEESNHITKRIIKYAIAGIIGDLQAQSLMSRICNTTDDISLKNVLNYINKEKINKIINGSPEKLTNLVDQIINIDNEYLEKLIDWENTSKQISKINEIDEKLEKDRKLLKFAKHWFDKNIETKQQISNLIYIIENLPIEMLSNWWFGWHNRDLKNKISLDNINSPLKFMKTIILKLCSLVENPKNEEDTVINAKLMTALSTKMK